MWSLQSRLQEGQTAGVGGHYSQMNLFLLPFLLGTWVLRDWIKEPQCEMLIPGPASRTLEGGLTQQAKVSENLFSPWGASLVGAPPRVLGKQAESLPG